MTHPTTPISTLVRPLLVLGLCCAAAVISQAATQIISINFNENGGRRAMAASDLAGVGEFRVNNWNNVRITNTPASISVPGNTLIYNDGSTVGSSFNATFTLTGTSLATVSPTPINDAALYSGASILTGGSRSIELTNVPFSNYAIYVFVLGPTNTRGGSVGIGSETYFVRGTSTAPTDTGSGYLRATNTSLAAALDNGTRVSGNYVLFGNLSGANQTISLAALDMGDSANLRFNITGIQIVAIPEPNSYAAIAGFAGLIIIGFSRRRRKA